MPGSPCSSTPWIASPTGCTKQLISVAAMPVPAALMMRPAPSAPCRRLSTNSACYRFAQLRRLGLGDAARDAPEDVVGGLLVALRVFFEQDVDGKLLRCDGNGGSSGGERVAAGSERVCAVSSAMVMPSSGAAMARGAIDGMRTPCRRRAGG